MHACNSKSLGIDSILSPFGEITVVDSTLGPLSRALGSDNSAVTHSTLWSRFKSNQEMVN